MTKLTLNINYISNKFKHLVVLSFFNPYSHHNCLYGVANARGPSLGQREFFNRNRPQTKQSGFSASSIIGQKDFETSRLDLIPNDSSQTVALEITIS